MSADLQFSLYTARGATYANHSESCAKSQRALSATAFPNGKGPPYPGATLLD